MRSHHRRNLRPGSTLVSFIVLFTLFGMVFGAVLDARAGDFAANPTQEPTEEPIDDIVANPTEEPTREPIDDIVSNPTEEPTREPIDDVVANPTEEQVDDEAIPTTGTVRVIKKDCPSGVPDDGFLSDYLFLCPDAHSGVEFVVNDVNGAQSGVTEDGVVEWTGVDPGVFNITETIPAGYGDPIVFCGYTESPGGGVQHPARQVSTGGIVEGTFPDAMFEFVCYWMNVEEGRQVIPGADDIAIAEGDRTADFLLFKRVCENDIPPHQTAAYYLEHCTEILDGIPFTVSHANGDSTKTTTDGEAKWHGIPLGPFTVDEDLPVQFGEPIVFCGWTAIYEGIVYDAFSQQVPAPGGTVELDVSIPGATHFCYYFNVKGVGDLADPSARDNTLVTRKWDCPDGTLSNQPDRDYYYQRCSLMLEPVEFTLTSADGDDTKATSGGFAEWAGVPLGDFTLTEEIPSGYGRPTVFCGWYAFYDGSHYDAFPQLVILAAANVIEGSITIPNTDYFCDVFNIAGDIEDFQANPTEVPAIDDFQGNATAGTVRLEKRDCPIGVVETATLAEYLTLCPKLHDGVGFTLETSAGTMQDTTAMGQAQWTGVPSGTFAIQEEIPAGYKDPLVFCGFTESLGGGVQHPALVESAGGLVEGTFPENTIFEYVCYWMNLKATGQVGIGADDLVNASGGGSSVVVVKKRTCPFGTPLDLDMSAYAEQCTGSLDGVQFTVSHANGSTTKPVVDGQAQWQGLPLGPFSVQETIPGGYGEPVISCMVIASAADGVWAYVSYVNAQPAPGGLIEIDLEIPADLDPPEIASTHTTCTSFNMPLGPGSVTQPQETSNDLSVRKWICPGDTEPVADQDYLESQCSLSTFPVEFTLTNAGGASTQSTDPAWTTWENVPLGEFTLQETIPDGYAEPIVFCEWTAFYDGLVYDDFSHPVPAAGGLVEGEITIPNTSYACDFFNITSFHDIYVHTNACPEGIVPTGSYWDGNTECDNLGGVGVQLITDSGTQEGVTAGATAQMGWSYVDLGPSGTIQIHQETPEGFGEPIVWCVSFPVAGDAQDFLFFSPTVTDGTVTVEPEQHYPFKFSCNFFNIPDGTGFGGPDSVTANPGDESNTLVAHKWFCEEGTAADAHLLDYFEQCQLATEPVEFTLNNGDGESTQATVDGTATWEDVPLGPFTLQETIPAGYEVLVVWCGWTAFYNGAVYDAFSQPVPSQDGLVEGEISVPNTHARCDFINAPVVIDDLQANPTEVAGIDDLVANPTEEPTEEPIDDVVANPDGTGTLTVRSWECPPLHDPLAGNALDDCAEVLNGITFDLVNHAEGQPDYQATSGDVIAGAAVFEPQPGTYSLKEQIPDGYGEPFLWQCSGLSIEGLEPPISTINFFRIVIDAGQSIECDWMSVPGAIDDFQANPTQVPTEEPVDDLVANPTEGPTEEPIDDITSNPTEVPVEAGTVEVHVYDCPAGVPLNAAPYSSVWWVTNPDYTSIYDYWELCPDQPEGITVTLEHSGGSDVAVTAGEFILFEGVGPGAFTLAVELPAGYGNPIVYCAFRDEAGMLHPELKAVPGGVVTDAMLDGGDEYFCYWFNIPLGDGAGSSSPGETANRSGAVPRWRLGLAA